MYRYFDNKEFEMCTPSCSLSNMSQSFMNRLDMAREIAGIPFVLNCAYRSVSWDKLHGRSGNSYHTLGRAVDIRCLSSKERYKIVAALLKSGFTGIGVNKTFIHVDDRVVTDPLIFLY